MIGRWLAARRRDDIVVTTKVGARPHAPGPTEAQLPVARAGAAPGRPGQPELFDFAAEQPDFTVLAYSPLRAGGYADRSRLTGEYLHPTGERRLRTLDRIAAELGATANQVVLAWLLSGDVPVIPVFGVSSTAQLDEALAAVDLTLPAEARLELDAA